MQVVCMTAADVVRRLNVAAVPKPPSLPQAVMMQFKIFNSLFFSFSKLFLMTTLKDSPRSPRSPRGRSFLSSFSSSGGSSRSKSSSLCGWLYKMGNKHTGMVLCGSG